MISARLIVSIFGVLILNVLIYFRAEATIEPVHQIFAECARNSGRTSAAINLLTLLMIGYFGLKTIYNDARLKSILLWLVTLFAVNHLIHFFFVAQNFEMNHMDLTAAENLHGVILYICLVALPFLTYFVKKLNIWMYLFTILHLFNATYMIGITFYGRYKPGIDEAYLHRIGVAVMLGAIALVIYRVFSERNKPWVR